MRLIRVTDSTGVIYDLDIDDKTSIGIDFQTYDFKEPGKRKINISNSFTVPATSHNMRSFGFPGNVHTRSNRFYEKWYVDYWIDNTHFVKNARVRIEEVDLEDNRISLFVFEKADIWEDMRNLLWPDMIPELLTWLRDVKGYPVMFSATPTNSFTGSLQQFLNQYVGNTEGLTMPYYFGNLAKFQKYGETVFSENEWEPASWWGTLSLYRYSVDPAEPTNEYFAEGGHFAIFARTLFEFLEYKYSYNFYTTGGGFVGNIWDDSMIVKTYTPIRDICVSNNNIGGSGGDWNFFQRDESYPGYFYPYKETADKADKSIFDFVQSFFHHYNIVVDNEENDTNIKLRRFDDITTDGTVYDWSGLSKMPKFKSYITGYAQKNYIKFASVYVGGNAYANAKEITCGNTSLDAEGDLFEIDAHIPGVSKTFSAPLLDTEESFETFQFFVNSATPTFVAVRVRCYDRANTTEHVAYVNLYTAQLVSMTTEYLTLEAALAHPEYYEIEKWLSMSDMVKFGPFNLYYFQELNGTYFINKISGFNPDKSKSATKIEVIKINDSAPPAIFNTDYWTDGTGDPWWDGDFDYWI